MRGTAALGVVWFTLGCGAKDESALPMPVPAAGCPVGDVELPDGSCQPPGVPPERCAAGFATDGDGGCVAVLPAPCPDGTMAVPGETACREVAPCDGGPWGDAPVDGSTVYVDAFYPGIDSDGSLARPWRTVSEAIEAAPSGALVAIAAGTYAENLRIEGRPVRLWGRCPREVTLQGVVGASQTLLMLTGASGSEIHDLAITGPGLGVAMSNVLEVVLDRAWVHDASTGGVEVVDLVGPASVTVRRSLIERVSNIAIHAGGAAIHIEESVIRDTLAVGQPADADGINIQAGPASGAPSELSVRASVIERSHGTGVIMTGSNAVIEATVVRDGQPRPDGFFGRGISVQLLTNTGEPSSLTLRGSVVERNFDVGVTVLASHAVIEDTVLRDQMSLPSGMYGDGLTVHPDYLMFGGGNGERSSIVMRRALVQGNHEVGIGIMSATGLVESVLVRDTRPNGLGHLGAGIHVSDLEPFGGGNAEVRSSAVQASHTIGVAVLGSEIVIENVAVSDTLARQDGSFGDGISIDTGYTMPTNARAERLLVVASARAGIANFGSHLALANSTLECNLLTLTAQDAYRFDDGGGNRCGCDGTIEPCKVSPATLEPPEPLPPPPAQ